jgi:phenylpyruvate tautomerase PptA (4-oxalocrotonate tautomerase family)
MPIIELHLLKGQPSSVRTRLANAMTDAFRMIVPAPPAAITVLLHEIERENYMRGGAFRQRTQALPEPVSALQEYRAALRDGDFEKADSFLTKDCEFHVPGGGVMHSPAEVVHWIFSRSKVLGFDLESSDVSPGERGPIVYLRGRILGEFHDGVPYENVSIVTRYEFDKDKIHRVHMWNDIADHLIVHAAKTGVPVTPAAVPGKDSADR